jgi:hypothetical protein
MMNLPMTSVMELRGHRMAIAACFAFQREIGSSVLGDFFDSIGQNAKYSSRVDVSALAVPYWFDHGANLRRSYPKGSEVLSRILVASPVGVAGRRSPASDRPRECNEGACSSGGTGARS